MKDFDLTSLRLFVEVCDARSIKKVAERERVDASSITKRLARLESELQTALLKRIRQGVQATAEGALFCEHARRLVLDAKKMSDAFLNRNTGGDGAIAIASHMSSMACVLTDDLASFKSLHQNTKVSFHVTELLSKDAVQMVREGRAHMAVIWDNTETSELQHVHYYDDHLVAAMNRDHPLAQRTDISIGSDFALDLIADRHGQHTMAYLQRTAGLNNDSLRLVASVDSSYSALRLAASGVGVYFCQRKVAEIHADSLNLAVVPLSNAWATVRIKIVYPSHLRNGLVKSLIAHLSHQHP